VNDPLIKSNSQVPAANITHTQCVEGFLINYRCLNAASRKPDANKGNKNWGQNLSILGNFSEGYRAHKVSSNAPAKDTNYETMTSTCLSTTWPDNSFAWGRQTRKMENGRGQDQGGGVGNGRQVQRTFLSHTYKLRARLCRVRFGLRTKDLGVRTQDAGCSCWAPIGGYRTSGKSTENNASWRRQRDSRSLTDLKKFSINLTI